MAKSLQAIPKNLSLSDQQTFRVPLPKTPLEFTGERVTSLTQGEILHEHLHRYFFALQFCAGKRVLDIASGEGYGSALLASVANSVVGVDVAAEAIQHAAENYAADNLSFLCGDTRRIPLSAGSVEVVVSFETIEHLGEQEEFIREIKRVLRPGGLLILSTPDREFFASSPPNPFHVKELSRADFQAFLGEHFKNSSFLVQSSLTGSLIVPQDGERPDHGKYEGFRRVHDNVYQSAPGLPAAMYMIGVASDGPLPEMRAGSFDDREFQLALYAELQRRHIEILHREADVEALRVEKSASLVELNRLREEQFRREGESETKLRLTREEKSRVEAALDTALREREAEARRNDEEVSRIRSGLTKLQEDKIVLQAEAEKLHTEIDHLRAGLRQRDDNLRRLEAEVANLKNRISALQALESQARVEIQQLRHQQAQSEKESAAVAANLIVQRDAYRRNVAELREEVDAVKGSLSWTLSAPLRWIAKPAAGIHAAAMKAMYGTSAFQYTGKPLARLFSNVSVPGLRWLLPQNPLFDVEYYQRRYPDAAKASKNSWAHYLAYGCDESRDPHPLFQSAYYNARNPDVAAAGVNPLIHYFEHGARENRDPNPNFDTSYYIQHYPDVKASGMNPLIHFMHHGKAEGRRTSGRQVEAVKAVQLVPMSLLPRNSGAAGQGLLISVLMPTFNTPPRYLRLAIDSVLRQSYQAWELCIYDDGSTSPETLETLREYRGRDPRIKIEFGNQNRGIATATNEAIALSQGQFITMLDHDDEIVPEALAEVASVLNSDSGIDALYTDQSYLEADGRIAEPFYKPDWSPDMFRGVMFIGHLLVVRRSLAVELGGFDAGFDRVQDFEFMLRVSEKCGKIYHLPKILYYWRRIPGSVAFHGNEKGPIEPIQASAVNAHLKRMRIPAVSEPHPSLAHRLAIKPAPRVSAPSVLIVVRDSSDPDVCISSILERSSYSNFKVLTSRPPDPAKVARHHLVESGNPAGPFGGSPDYILWIEPDLEVMTPDWIEHLLLYGEQRQIACVAPLLVNRDGTVWHAGLVLGMNGLVGYPMQGWPADSDGYAGSLSCAREASCVSGECLMISRQKLEAMGGMVPFYQDPLYGGADLSLMASTAGLRNVVNPRAVLRRLAESPASDSSKLDRALFADRWSEITKHGDRYYNPNFIPTSPGYEPKKMAAATVSA
jgi:GT2 family glycosyltransferase/SAM-dependent methyltransferase